MRPYQGDIHAVERPGEQLRQHQLIAIVVGGQRDTKRTFTRLMGTVRFRVDAAGCGLIVGGGGGGDGGVWFDEHELNVVDGRAAGGVTPGKVAAG